jgi:hypothetical protein
LGIGEPLHAAQPHRGERLSGHLTLLQIGCVGSDGAADNKSHSQNTNSR